MARGRAQVRRQAVSRARPLVRREATIARPARVRIRSRNPCVFARRRLFGWKVRLLTGGLPRNRRGRGRRAGRVDEAVDPDVETPNGTVRPLDRSNRSRHTADTPEEVRPLWTTPCPGPSALLASPVTGSPPTDGASRDPTCPRRTCSCAAVRSSVVTLFTGCGQRCGRAVHSAVPRSAVRRGQGTLAGSYGWVRKGNGWQMPPEGQD